jgi:anti-sigma B factor antagonist
MEVVDRAGELVVRPVGEIDLLTAPLLYELLRRARAGPAKRVVVDLSDTSLLVGRGIGVLAAAAEAFRSRGRSLVVTGARGVVGRALAACDLHDIVDGGCRTPPRAS